MSLVLPQPIAEYYKHDAMVNGDVAHCFTEDAVVRDEGHTYRGPAAIQQWKADASAKFQYTCQPLTAEQQEGRHIVTCEVAGNFPGSPVQLRFHFQLRGQKIAALEVIP